MKLRTGSLLILICSLAVAAAEGGTVSGRVTQAAGTPLPEANILIKGSSLAEPMGSTTDSDGSYSVDGLPAGTLSVTASHIGYHSASIDLQFLADAEIAHDFTFSAELIYLEQSVVTASRQQGKVLDAPASVAVLEAEDIQRQPVL